MTIKLTDSGLEVRDWTGITDPSKILLPIADTQVAGTPGRGKVNLDGVGRAVESRIIIAPNHGFTAGDEGFPMYNEFVFDDTNPAHMATDFVTHVIDINSLMVAPRGLIRFSDSLIENGSAYDVGPAGGGPFVYWDSSLAKYVSQRPSDSFSAELLRVRKVANGMVEAEILGWPPVSTEVTDSTVINATAFQYGVDRTGSSDTTLALKAALQDANVPGKGVLYIPAGTYLCEGTTSSGASVTIATPFEIGPSPLRIIGDGIGRTILKMTDTYPVRFFKNQSTLVTDFQISGVTFLGNNLGDFSAGLAFAFEAFDCVIIENCEFRNLTGGIIVGANDTTTQSNKLVIRNCRVTGENVVSASVCHVYNCRNVMVTDNTFDRCARIFDIETDTARSCKDLVFANNVVTNGDRATRTGNESCIPVHVDIEDTSEAVNGVVADNVFEDNHDDSAASLAGGIISIDHNGTRKLMPIAVTGDSGTEKFTATGHGLVNDQILRVVDNGSLPGGVSNSTLYYVVNKTSNDFQISTTLGGGAVDLTSNGTAVFVQHAVTADNTTETLTSKAHGLLDGDPVVFYHSGTMPAGLSRKRRYWVVNKTTDTFQVSLTRGGTAVDFTTDGTGVMTMESPVMMRHWTISGNVITRHRTNATSQSIWVDNGDYVNVTGNNLSECGNATTRGIIVRDTCHSVISGNVVDESYGTGLREMTGCRKNIWTNNRCGNKTFDDIAASASIDDNNLTGSAGI